MSTATQSIREIVARQPSAAGIFHRFDIDLRMQADLSLEGACQELQLSVDQVLEKLAEAEAERCGGTAFDPESLSLSRLIQHIVRVHHNRVRQELPRLAEMATKLLANHSDRATELTMIAELIGTLRGEMYVHIQKEEQVLFPFISQMDQESIVAYPPAHACFRSVTHPIFMMEQEHESADHIVAEIIRLTNHFEPPSWACATHTALFSGLREFEAGLRQHVHLENDILFPRAIKLEAEIKARR
ncbi:MAG: hemerythrin domain-containing protein [Terracidiphilus sp.]